MTSARYSEEVRRRCREAPRAGAWPADDPAVATGTFADAADETRIQVQLRVVDDRVVDARFKAFGCSAAIASGSVVAEQAIGRTVAGVGELNAQAVAATLELPGDKWPIATGAVAAAQAAANDWAVRTGARG